MLLKPFGPPNRNLSMPMNNDELNVHLLLIHIDYRLHVENIPCRSGVFPQVSVEDKALLFSQELLFLFILHGFRERSPLDIQSKNKWHKPPFFMQRMIPLYRSVLCCTVEKGGLEDADSNVDAILHCTVHVLHTAQPTERTCDTHHAAKTHLRSLRAAAAGRAIVRSECLETTSRPHELLGGEYGTAP